MLIEFIKRHTCIWHLWRSTIESIHGQLVEFHPDRVVVVDLPEWSLSGAIVIITRGIVSTCNQDTCMQTQEFDLDRRDSRSIMSIDRSIVIDR